MPVLINIIENESEKGLRLLQLLNNFSPTFRHLRTLSWNFLTKRQIIFNHCI